MHPNVKDLRGHTFGRLTVIERGPNSKDRHAQWRCQCACGEDTLVSGKELRNGGTQSCGCLKKAITSNIMRTHGQSGKTTYNIWIAMRDRCTNPQNIAYDRYGGAGITVCERWMTSFEAFLEDMGERPGTEYSLDRINNELGYTPTNTRWATLTEQARNRRKTLMVTVDGETIPLVTYAEQLGISQRLAHSRYRNGRLRFDRDYDSRRRHKTGSQSKHIVLYHGVSMPLSQAAQLAEITYSAALGRYKKGLFPSPIASQPLP